MDTSRRNTATILIFTLLVLVLLACGNTSPVVWGGQSSAYQLSTPFPMPVYIQGASPYAFDAAQATLVAGQSQLMELSHQATAVSLNMAQAAGAVAQSAQNNNQSQLMELSFQATAISVNMAQAAALQRYYLQQTLVAQNSNAIADANAARAAFLAQAILNGNATATAQAVAAQTAYPLTATPLAALQAAVAFQQGQYQQQSKWRGLITPMVIILSTLIVLLIILGCVLAYRRFMPVMELRMLDPGRYRSTTPSSLLIDGESMDADPRYRRLTPWELSRANLPQFPNGDTVHVEIIDPFEPLVAQWITEAEQGLHANRGKFP